MMFWLLAVLLIPVIAGLVLFLSAAEDFWDIIRLRVGFERLMGDLLHVMLIFLVAAGAEILAVVELFIHLF